jgi:hypothetical protein
MKQSLRTEIIRAAASDLDSLEHACPGGTVDRDAQTDVASVLLKQFYAYCNAAGLDFSYILKAAKRN